MYKYKILINEEISDEAVQMLLKNGVEIKRGMSCEEATVVKDIRDCDAVMTRTMKISRRVIENAPKLKVIAKHGEGYEMIDVDAATDLGIQVVYTPGANTNSVAEHTMALILACARQLRRTNIEYSKGNYGIKNLVCINELSSKKIGLVGFGKIARRVSEIAHFGFAMDVYFYDPFIKEKKIPEYIVQCNELEKLVMESDYVSIHVPETKETIELIGDKEISLMKKNAFLINTSRGHIIDQNALINAVKNERIAGAGLDVCYPEPICQDSELFKLDRIILTPHCGATSRDAMKKMGIEAAQGVIDILNGNKCKYPVNCLQ